jgi:hypothetical protein
MLIVAMLPFMSCSEPSDGGHGIESYRAYPYYFYESTGPNKFIKIGGAERPIEFDRDTSDAAAVESLLSLKWNVLYPNSAGVITLFGNYREEHGTFTLIHWQLPVPFKAYTGALTAEPGELKERASLGRSDFDKDIQADPAIYLRPPSAKR